MIKQMQMSPIRWLLYYVASTMLIFSIITANPITTVLGLRDILLSPSTLISDYMEISSMSSAFLNASIVTFMTLIMLDLAQVRYNGTSISAVLLMAGFSLFGKNFLNIIPIFIGVYIYALRNGDTFRKYIYTALFGTAIAPLVSEIAINFSSDGITLQSVSLGIIAGIISGFCLPALSIECLRILEGFNLYTTGFAAGLIGILFVSAIKSFGAQSESSMMWRSGQDPILCTYLYLLFLSLIVIGFLLNEKTFQGYSLIFRHSGRAVADFTMMDGIPLAFINMGVVGIFALTYLLVLNGDVNGPTVGAIFTITGFGALGKHLRNMVPPMLGVFLMSLISNWSLTDPSVQLAALFCTGLAPIAGQFGFTWGVIAGAMHSVIVLSVTSMHGGLNLYNNGFAAGLVVLILLPMIESIENDKD